MSWLLYILIGIIVIDVILILCCNKDGKFHDREIEDEKKHWDNNLKK